MRLNTPKSMALARRIKRMFGSWEDVRKNSVPMNGGFLVSSPATIVTDLPKDAPELIDWVSRRQVSRFADLPHGVTISTGAFGAASLFLGGERVAFLENKSGEVVIEITHMDFREIVPQLIESSRKFIDLVGELRNNEEIAKAHRRLNAVSVVLKE